MINRQDPMIATVVGYRLRHGAWPTRLRSGALPRQSAVHERIARLVDVVPSRDGVSWIAESSDGRQFKCSDDVPVPENARSRGLFERWLGRPSRWMERQLHLTTVQCGLTRRTRRRLDEAGIVTLGGIVRQRAESWATASVSSAAVLEIATALYDRGLAFGMTIEERDEGAIVTRDGLDPDVMFHRRDFESVGHDGSTVPSSYRRRMSVLEALAALSSEHAALAVAALRTSPVPPGADVLERLLHAPLALAARQSGMTPNQLVGYAANRVGVYHGMTTGSTSDWMAEVERALTWLAAVPYAAGLRFHGIGGETCGSYAEVGAHIGGIGEAEAYAHVSVFNATVNRLRPELPVTRATLAVLRRFDKPVLVERWWNALPEVIRPSLPADLASIAALGDWGWARPVTVCPCAGTHVAGFDADAVRSYAVGIGAAFEELYEWGAANVGAAAKWASITVAEARAVLVKDGRWVAVTEEWFVRGGRRGGALAEQVREAARLGDISAGVVHARLSAGASPRDVRVRPKGWDVPPVEVVGRVLAELGLDVMDVVDAMSARAA